MQNQIFWLKFLQISRKHIRLQERTLFCKTEDGELTALIDKCPHQGKRLSDGWCEENKVVCPYHRYSFDLKTGLGSGTGIDVFPLSEREDGLYVGINRWVWF